MKSALVAFLSGTVFAVGLILAGMTQPAKVIGFLDVAGAWDPSLAFVMVGAIGVHALTRRMVLRRGKPFGAESFDEPAMRPLDAGLVAGGALFGVGWGVAGYCPGPALVALGTGSAPAVVFVAGTLIGMGTCSLVRGRLLSGGGNPGHDLARAGAAEPVSPLSGHGHG
jgi:uncharacterized membrane protein YedE/YeeE